MRFCDYPSNLIREVCPDIELQEKRPADFVETLAYLLAGMPEKHQEVIRKRFYDGKTLRQAGAQLGITGARVRQIEQKALSYLCHPMRQKYLRLGVRGVIAQEVEAARKQAGEAVATAMARDIEHHNEKIDLNDAAASSMSIDRLGLSVRARNCLSRRGCATVYDILRLTPEEFWKTRNLGSITGEEIIEKLEKLHFKCEKFTNARRY